MWFLVVIVVGGDIVVKKKGRKRVKETGRNLVWENSCNKNERRKRELENLSESRLKVRHHTTIYKIVGRKTSCFEIRLYKRL